MKNTLIITAALTGLVMASAAHADDMAPTGKEKCYGISKAGKNDCASKVAGNSCAGLSTKDNQGFLVVPKGLCDKLVGGSVMEEKN